MTYYILKKDIISSQNSYEENCSNKIMMILMRITSNTRKFSSFFKENVDDQTCQKTFENTSSRAQNAF